MKKQRKKNKNKSWDRKDGDMTEVPIMSISTNWGNDRNAYFEGEGDSATESDEEHNIEEAVENDIKHYRTLDEQSFKLWGNKKALELSIDQNDQIADDTFEHFEAALNEQNHDELRKCVRSVVKYVTEAAKTIRECDFSDSLEDQARKQLLLSLLTNGCFYLHLVGSGFKGTSHPALTQINKINERIGYKPEAEDEQYENEEEEEFDDNEIEQEIPKEKAIPEKHIPNHLQKIEEGEYRAVSRNILKNQVVIPSKPIRSKAPRSKRRRKYAHAMHEFRKTHKIKTTPRDGVYRGEMAGISLQRKSVKLHPAH